MAGTAPESGLTDTAGGWRADKPQGGCILDIASGTFVTRGLCMPHSPRSHDGRLWVLESGTGGGVLVDRDTGQRETIAQLPGFTRGLAIVGAYAFVGLSRIRATSAMDGVPLAERRDDLKCGIAAIDLRGGVAGVGAERSPQPPFASSPGLRRRPPPGRSVDEGRLGV